MRSDNAPTPPANPAGEPGVGDAWQWSPPDEIVMELPTLISSAAIGRKTNSPVLKLGRNRLVRIGE
jgi:hypothetical protein